MTESVDSLEAFVKKLSYDQYEAFRQAISVGRWPDGNAVDAQKKAWMMEAVLMYESLHSLSDRALTGHIPQQCKSKEKTDPTLPLKWKH